MRKTILIFSCCAFCLGGNGAAYRSIVGKELEVHQGDVPEATQTNLDDSKWETVTIPHDWAIFGPFDRNNDLQEVAVTQDLEKQASVKTGRTGGLPYVGVGWYRTAFDASADKQVTLVFDGAMSEARVYVNGKEACFWPFGYNSFHCDVTGLLNADGKNNVLAVRLENRPQSSRWYPGRDCIAMSAWLLRNVFMFRFGVHSSPHRMFLLNTLPCVCVLQYGMPVMRMFVFLLILLRRTVR